MFDNQTLSLQFFDIDGNPIPTDNLSLDAYCYVHGSPSRRNLDKGFGKNQCHLSPCIQADHICSRFKLSAVSVLLSLVCVFQMMKQKGQLWQTRLLLDY
jgi:hypothetical protein